jgi:hypothetical protein
VNRRSIDASDQAPLRFRWVCDCANPPVLLAIYDETGRIEVKVRQRRYVAQGWLEATCPRCGARHVLQLRPPDRSAPGRGAMST